jgi:hypothetical protein
MKQTFLYRAVRLVFDITMGEHKSTDVTPQIILSDLKKSRGLVNGLLGFGLFAALFGGVSCFLFLSKITAGNDWLFKMVNQLAHKIIHVLGLVVALQANCVIPFL